MIILLTTSFSTLWHYYAIVEFLFRHHHGKLGRERVDHENGEDSVDEDVHDNQRTGKP